MSIGHNSTPGDVIRSDGEEGRKGVGKALLFSLVLLVLAVGGCKGELITTFNVDEPAAVDFELRLTGLVVEAIDEDPARLDAIVAAMADTTGAVPAVTRNPDEIRIGVRDIPIDVVTAHSDVTGIAVLIVTENQVLVEMVQPVGLLDAIAQTTSDPALVDAIAQTTYTTLVLTGDAEIVLGEGDVSYVTTDDGGNVTLTREMADNSTTTWKFNIVRRGSGMVGIVLVVAGSIIALVAIAALLRRRNQSKNWDAPST